MAHDGLAQLAAVLGAAGAALVLLPWSRRAPLAAGLGLLAAAEALLGYVLVPSRDLHRLSSPVAGLAVLVGAGAVVALHVLFVRRPVLVPFAVLAAAPIRVPVDLGDQRAFLLIPLYVVLAATALALLRALARGPVPEGLPRLVGYATTALVALDALSLLWAEDRRQGSIELGFFVFPFAVLVAVVARTPFAAWMTRQLAILLVALSSAFAVVGLWQAKTHRLFFAHDLDVANAYTSFFRVTSVFKDPSLYGRYLVFAIVVLVVALMLRRISVRLAAPLVALLWAGLYFSYSQTSMFTLFVVTIAIVLVAGERQERRAVIVACVVLALGAGGAFAVAAQHHSSRHVTSGRSRLVAVTLPVIRHRPIWGVGVGSQPLASHRLAAKKTLVAKNASHTTPLTVAAELGLLGFLAYLAFLVTSALLLRDLTRRDRALGLGLAAVFLTLVVHSLFYSGFFEDPVTWGVVALAAAAMRDGLAMRKA
jgi:hypothetical protein